MVWKVVLGIAGVLVVALGLTEAFLRLRFGFGNPLIYQADSQIGYLLAPNQRTRRFGNRIEINAYSMRAKAISPQRPPDTLRLLLLGDSIANGGWWTDQPEIISEMLANQLRRSPTLAQRPIEVLNASANSWGPRNEWAYLQRFGSFEAQIIIVLINTDDLFATQPTPLPVGRDRNYPDRKPWLALEEVIKRYLLKAPPLPDELQALQAEEGDRVERNLAAIAQIQQHIEATQGHLVLAMTPLKRELASQGGPRDYELIARQRLSNFAQKQQIPYIDFLPVFDANDSPEALYRDHIHLSPRGNQLISRHLQKVLETLAPLNSQSSK